MKGLGPGCDVVGCNRLWGCGKLRFLFKRKKIVSSIKPFGTRAWRKRLGFTREQAAELLGVSVYTIKSYEIGQRQVPTPTRRLMARLEGESGEASAGQPAACVVAGGGSLSSGRVGVDLVARPSEEIPRLCNAILAAHDVTARTHLTREQDPGSRTVTDMDLVKLAENLVQDPDLTTLVWGVWTAGQASGRTDYAEAAAIEETLSRRPSNLRLLRVGTLLAQPGMSLSTEDLLCEAKRLWQACHAEAVVVHDGVRALLWCQALADTRIDSDLELILASGLAIALDLDDQPISTPEPVAKKAAKPDTIKLAGLTTI